MEPRHPDFVTDDCVALLKRHDVALVVADSGRWPRFEQVTASFMYLRLHGSPITYASQYSDGALDQWAASIRKWRRRGDVYVYFDNDGHAHAPHDALRLMDRLQTD